MRVIPTPTTTVPGSATAVERPLSRDGHQRGGGSSRWNDLAVTRWREDATCDNWGTFCYLRDVASGEFWSTAHQPVGTPGRSLRGDILGGARRISPPRSRTRRAHRDRGLAGGRHRAAPDADRQPLARAQGHRDHELRRSRPGAAGGRRQPSGVLQPVRADRNCPRRSGRSCARAGRARPTSGRRGCFT